MERKLFGEATALAVYKPIKLTPGVADENSKLFSPTEPLPNRRSILFAASVSTDVDSSRSFAVCRQSSKASNLSSLMEWFMALTRV